MNFLPLNVYTNYALLQSALTLEAYVNELVKRKLNAGGISDPGFFFAYPEFSKKGQEKGLKPLFGIRLTIEGDDIVFFIKNRTGYHALLKLYEELEQGRLVFSSLKEYTEDLITIYPSSNLFKYEFKKEIFRDTLKKWAMVTNVIYVGLETANDEFKSFLRLICTEFNYSLVAFPLIKYLTKTEAKTLKMVEAIKASTTLDMDEKFSGIDYFLSPEEAANFYTEAERENTFVIADLIDFSLNEKHPLKLPLPHVYDPKLVIKEMTDQALLKYGLDQDETYLKRRDYELGIIDSLNFTNYFLIVSDYVNFAKNAGILVGYGRGSAPGSLVSYLLGITHADPIKYKLLFERFLNPSRVSLPDIDIDFMDTRRNEVIDYIKSVYGEDKVAQIVTFQTNASKASLRDVGRIYQVNPKFIDRLSKSIGNTNYTLRESYLKLPAFKKMVDEDSYNLKIIKEAIKLVGFPRQTGLHAAGLIIDAESLPNSLPTFLHNNTRISQYEMSFLEESGFLKVDILGLTNLTFIDNIIKRENVTYDRKLDFYHLSFEDPNIYKVIREGHVLGLFQLESEGMRRAIRLVEPTTFDDVAALLALYRPGPMAYIKDYAAAKKGDIEVGYLNETLKEILAPTYGIMIYQEQIMEIAVVMAGFSFAQADLLRRAISKKDETIILQEQKNFIQGALDNNYLQEEAKKVFNDILKFAQYGFNKSHSVVYAMTTMALAYLKTNHSESFFVELLKTSYSDRKKVQEIRKELQAFNLRITTPDIHHSTNEYIVINNEILTPFIAINGITRDIGALIISLRSEAAFISFENFVYRAFTAGVKSNHIIALIESGAFDSFDQNRSYLKDKFNRYLPILDIGLFSSEDALYALIVDKKPENMQLKISEEIMRLGFPLSRNPLEDVTVSGTTSFTDLKVREGAFVTVRGVLLDIKEIKTKKGDLMAFLSLSDYENELPIVLFPRTYANLHERLALNEIYIISGRIELRDDELQLLADQIERYRHD